MFWNTSSIKGYDIAATDGDVGHVDDILIDDVGWKVLWLIVPTGSWLNRRVVCLPAWALGQPDPETHDLAVRLSRQQIEGSPEYQGDHSIPNLLAEREVEIGDYYAGLNPATGEREPGSLDTLVRLAPVSRTSFESLISLNVLTGATVEALDGEIGHVESLVLDPLTWAIKYLVVHTGAWWADKKVLILPDTVASIDDLRAIIGLNVNCEKVRGSPEYVEAETVDGSYDEQFHIYYGIKWMKK
jgi:uncharacterized protein YrrD